MLSDIMLLSLYIFCLTGLLFQEYCGLGYRYNDTGERLRIEAPGFVYISSTLPNRPQAQGTEAMMKNISRTIVPYQMHE